MTGIIKSNEGSKAAGEFSSFFHSCIVQLDIIKVFFISPTDALYRVSQEEWTKLRESVPYVNPAVVP